MFTCMSCVHRYVVCSQVCRVFTGMSCVHRYDTEGIGTTSGEKIMQKLGILIQKHNEGDNPDGRSHHPRCFIYPIYVNIN